MRNIFMNKEEFSSLVLQGNLLKAFSEVVTASLVIRLVLVSNLLSIYLVVRNTIGVWLKNLQSIRGAPSCKSFSCYITRREICLP